MDRAIEQFFDLARQHLDKLLGQGEDLTAQTFLRAWEAVPRYQVRGAPFVSWLLRIAHNLAIDHFRRGKRYPEVVLEDGSRALDSMQFAEDSYEDLQVMKETRSRLRDLVKQLPEEQKQVLIMRHYLQMSFQEIADRTGVSINTALGRMRYALINLRKKMTQSKIAYDKSLYPKGFDQIPIPRDLGGGIEGDQ